MNEARDPFLDTFVARIGPFIIRNNPFKIKTLRSIVAEYTSMINPTPKLYRDLRIKCLQLLLKDENETYITPEAELELNTLLNRDIGELMRILLTSEEIQQCSNHCKKRYTPKKL